jgi:hypothetical protein
MPRSIARPFDPKKSANLKGRKQPQTDENATLAAISGLCQGAGSRVLFSIVDIGTGRPPGRPAEAGRRLLQPP